MRGGGRRETGEGRREKGEGRREKGEGRREKVAYNVSVHAETEKVYTTHLVNLINL